MFSTTIGIFCMVLSVVCFSITATVGEIRGNHQVLSGKDAENHAAVGLLFLIFALLFLAGGIAVVGNAR